MCCYSSHSQIIPYTNTPRAIDILIHDYVHLITGCLQHCKRVNFENSSRDQGLLLLFRLSIICIELLSQRRLAMPHRKVKLRQEVSKGRRNRPNVPGREGSYRWGNQEHATNVRNIRWRVFSGVDPSGFAGYQQGLEQSASSSAKVIAQWRFWLLNGSSSRDVFGVW